MIKKMAPYVYHIALIQATVATIGSLYFSEMAGYPPCVLCWYQRIAMYPLVVIFMIGIIRQDRYAAYYAVPLVIIGWVISFFHTLLYYHVIPQSVSPCQAGISCTTKYIEWFGFLTIPLLSFLAFSALLVLLFVHWKYVKSDG